jgi:hypothetical protein
MSFLKKGMYALLFVGLVTACGGSDDEPMPPVAPTITVLEFTTTASGDGTIISVLPSSVGGTSYTVDFGTEATDDVIETAGAAVEYDYPNVDGSTSYSIVVTAKADGMADVSKTTEVAVVFVAPTSLVNFEDDAEVDLVYKVKAGVTMDIGAATMGSDYGNVAKINYVGGENPYPQMFLRLAKHFDLSTESTLSLDIYLEANTAATKVLLKLEDINVDTKAATAMDKIEVEVMTVATTEAGWQTVSFDFTEAVRSGDGAGDTLDLTEFATIGLFIGVDLKTGLAVAGTYEVDNIRGGVFGSAVLDTDNDGVLDNSDDCATESGTLDNGCNAPTGPEEFAMLDFEDFTLQGEGFGGAKFDVIDNPDTSNTLNTSAKVLRYIKNSEETYGGFVILLKNPIDMTVKKKFSLKVKAPAARAGDEFLFKLENKDDAAINSEVRVAIAADSDWQTITFDHTAGTGSYQKLVVIIANGVAADGSEDWTFLIDDIQQLD